MAVLEYNGISTGAYLVSESNGYRSKATVTLASGENLQAGSLVGVITESGKYARYNPSNTDGTETVAGILHQSIDATDGDVKCVVVNRDAEVNAQLLTYSDGADEDAIATANTELDAIGIVVR